MTITGRLLASRLAVGIGLVSYSAYLWHQPLFAFARVASMEPPSAVVFTFLSFASLGLAYVSWRYVEQPFRQRQNFTRAKIFSFSAACMVLFLFLVGTGYALNGLSTRFTPQDADLLISHESRSKYVRARHTSLRSDSAFSSDTRFRVLIIGDSFSQDLVNVLHEANLLPGTEIRVRYIPAQCQIYQGDAPVSDFVDPKSREICEKDNYAGLTELIGAADAVLVAASWKVWSAERLYESFNRLGILRKEHYLVFGPKSFGHINRAAYTRLSVDERIALRNPIASSVVDINAILRRNTPPGHFVDVHELLCGSETLTCPIFNESGALLSYDGSHLTQPGALYLGTRLAKDSAFKRIAEIAVSAQASAPSWTCQIAGL